MGYIVRRRCMGKNLAFANIKQLGNTGSAEREETNSWSCESDFEIDQTNTVKVVFRRDSAVWNKDWDNTFPDKDSKLPYGGKVSIVCEPISTLHDEGQSFQFFVREWKLLEDHPREKALVKARSSEAGGTCLTTYLRSRREEFEKFNDAACFSQSKEKDAVPWRDNRVSNSEFSHGDEKAKSRRAHMFAAWLIRTYGRDFLRKNGGVLDIAGGKGKLSVELALQGGIRCTIIDPLIRKHGQFLHPRDAKRIRKASVPHPQLLAKTFNTGDFLDEEHSLVDGAQILVGLHPDECTEDILDAALIREKPFAIVPCCVFPGIFTSRMRRDPTTGKTSHVRSYEHFLDYLLAKDSRLEKTELDFEGRNTVIYLPRQK